MIKWIKDEVQERCMDRVGLEYRFGVTVASKDIDMGRSRTKNVRASNEFDQDHAMRLALLMEDNKPFKAAVLWKPPRSDKHIVLHGVHRSGAAIDILGEKELMCYLITGPDKQLAKLVDMYARSANTYDMDKSPSVEDSYYNAKWFISNGKTRKEAALLVGLSEDTVTKYSRQDQILDELRESGVDVRKLTRAHVTPLSPVKLVKVRKALASLVIRYKLPSTDIYSYSKQVLAKGNEVDQLNEVTKVEKLLRRVKRPASTEMLDVRIRSEWQRAMSRLANKLSTRLQVRTLLNCLTTEDMRFAKEFGEKLVILGDQKHAAQKREEKIVGTNSDEHTGGVAEASVG